MNFSCGRFSTASLLIMACAVSFIATGTQSAAHAAKEAPLSRQTRSAEDASNNVPSSASSEHQQLIDSSSGSSGFSSSAHSMAKRDASNIFNDYSKRGAPRFVGKRQPAPRFVGKRMFLFGKRQAAPRFVGKRQPAPRFVGKRQAAPRFVGKRQAAPRFVGKRQAAPRFVGKRTQSDGPAPYLSAQEFIQTFRKSDPYFMGKREAEQDMAGEYNDNNLDSEVWFDDPFEVESVKRGAPRFVGKRGAPRFVGKRGAPRFVGKRGAPRFVGKRGAPRFVGKRGAPRFVGKRGAPRFVGKRGAPRFVGKRDLDLLSDDGAQFTDFPLFSSNRYEYYPLTEDSFAQDFEGDGSDIETFASEWRNSPSLSPKNINTIMERLADKGDYSSEISRSPLEDEDGDSVSSSEPSSVGIGDSL